MKKLTILSLIAVSLLGFAKAATDLTDLGSSSFTVVGDFTTAPYSQTTSVLTLGGTFSLADTLYGTFGSPFNWSSEPGFGLSMHLTGAVNPAATFTLDFYNGAGDAVLASFSGATDSVTIGTNTVTLTLESGLIADLIDVGGLYLTWGSDAASGASDIEVYSVQSVPEPSTYALLAMSAVGLGGYVVRRRRR